MIDLAIDVRFYQEIASVERPGAGMRDAGCGIRSGDMGAPLALVEGMAL